MKYRHKENISMKSFAHKLHCIKSFWISTKEQSQKEKKLHTTNNFNIEKLMGGIIFLMLCPVILSRNEVI